MSIKEEIHALSDEMITNLGRLVAIDSQLGTPAEGMPFGEGPAKALSEGLKIAQELGFHTVNLDNYCGYAEMGEGEEIVGIAGHLDIVPVGGDWTHDPFKLTREGNYVYGRGTTDDKGPVLEALYAMKLLHDSGVKLNKRVRLIMGCNEETGSKCMEHYNEVAEELSCGFTPDANFPCIHGEKGYMSMMAYSKNTKIISMNGGFVSNAVCDTCTTVIPASAGMKDKLEEAGIEISWILSEKELDKKMRNVEYFAEQPVDTVISLDNDDTEKAVDIILNDDRISWKLYGDGRSEKLIYYLDKGTIQELAVPNEYYMGYQSIVLAAQNIRYYTDKTEQAEVEFYMVSKDNLYDEETSRILFPAVR